MLSGRKVQNNASDNSVSVPELEINEYQLIGWTLVSTFITLIALQD